MKNYLQNVFALDERSLGLARILIGFIGAFYFFEYFKEVDLLYSENAILSYRNIVRLTAGPEETYPFRIIRDLHLLPLLKLSQTSFYVSMVTLTGIFAALMVMIGFQTKFFCIVAWLIGTTMYDRFPSVFHGGDLMLKLSFLWMFFLPCEKQFSLDAKKTSSTIGYQHVSFASAFWMLQLLIVYILNVYYKVIDPKWYPQLDAFYYLSHADYVLSSVGKYLTLLPYKAGQLGTLIVLLLEAFVPFLMFVPNRPRLRMWLIVVFVIFHAGIWLSINVSFVSQFTIIWWLSLLPAAFWEKATVRRLSLQYILPGTAERLLSGPLKTAFLFLISGCIFLSTANIMTGTNKIYSPRSAVGGVVRWLQLEQWWSMFSRNPKLEYDGWFVAEALLKDGTTVDLFTEKPVSFDRPKDYLAIYKTYHFRKFFRDYSESVSPFLDSNVAAFLCRHWNSNHEADRQVEQYSLFFMDEHTPEPQLLKAIPQAKKTLKFTRNCQI